MYLDLKIKLGKQPTIRQFSETYKVSNEKMALILGRNAFSKLVTLCGDKPVSFGRDKSSHSVFQVVLLYPRRLV